RRRHTSFSRDWSSDVCSSDLDLVATVVEGGTRRGYFYNIGQSAFVAADGTSRSDAALRGLARTAGQEVTYTCTPPGSGRRIADQIGRASCRERVSMRERYGEL